MANLIALRIMVEWKFVASILLFVPLILAAKANYGLFAENKALGVPMVLSPPRKLKSNIFGQFNGRKNGMVVSAGSSTYRHVDSGKIMRVPKHNVFYSQNENEIARIGYAAKTGKIGKRRNTRRRLPRTKMLKFKRGRSKIKINGRTSKIKIKGGTSKIKINGRTSKIKIKGDTSKVKIKTSKMKTKKKDKSKIKGKGKGKGKGKDKGKDKTKKNGSKNVRMNCGEKCQALLKKTLADVGVEGICLMSEWIRKKLGLQQKCVSLGASDSENRPEDDKFLGEDDKKKDDKADHNDDDDKDEKPKTEKNVQKRKLPQRNVRKRKLPQKNVQKRKLTPKNKQKRKRPRKYRSGVKYGSRSRQLTYPMAGTLKSDKIVSPGLQLIKPLAANQNGPGGKRPGRQLIEPLAATLNDEMYGSRSLQFIRPLPAIINDEGYWPLRRQPIKPRAGTLTNSD